MRTAAFWGKLRWVVELVDSSIEVGEGRFSGVPASRVFWSVRYSQKKLRV